MAKKPAISLWRDRSIGAKLGTAFGLILLAVVGLSIASIYNMSRVQKATDQVNIAQQIKDQSLRVQNALVLARREEQAFLLNWDSIDYDTAVNRYLVPFGSHVSDIRLATGKLEELIAGLGGEHPLYNEDIKHDLEELKSALALYRQEFSQVTTLLRKRGNPSSGVILDLNRKAKTLETSIIFSGAQSSLLQAYLELRLKEKDYLLRGRVQDQRQVTEAIYKLRNTAAAVNSREVVQMNSVLNSYQETFAELVQIDRQIQQHTDRYTKAAAKIQPLAVELTGLGTILAEQNMQEAIASGQNARNGLLTAILTAILFGAMLAVALTRQISLPLRQLTQTAQQIRYGNLDVDLPPAGRDEIGILTQTLTEMVHQLKESFENLEERVADRTLRLEIVAALGEHLSSILNLDDLLEEVVTQVQQNFGYYHAHIYLLDEKREQLVVAAGTGQAGEQMKASGHHIALSAPASLVARAARSGQIINVGNVREAPDWLPNPLLPFTRSEMAVPIVLRHTNQVVGVLDVQSDRLNGFDEGDANLLRTLANQIAVAINNARIFNEAQTALQEARAAQERYVKDAWTNLTSIVRSARYHYTRPGAPALRGAVRQQVRQKVQARPEPVLIPAAVGEPSQQQGETPAQAVAAPIVLHNIPIGILEIYPTASKRQWTEDDLFIIQTIVAEMAQTAETLRLFDETRQQAAREQITRQITDKMRAAPDVESIIETGLQELARNLGVPRTYVRLNPKELLSAPASGPSGNGGQPHPDSEVESTRMVEG
ncbi:MAG: GAF domain-containing protein [Chloroflexi bacterium]|nr:MAG: GAF domain-containing protein [Chloroflexota bacterium]